MKLIAFRIKNFRSILDSDWQNLSPDNVTCLIGQNESGKTSVLEALRAFSSGVISEDVLRSDLSLPEISCRFSIPEGWLLNITENPGDDLKTLLSGLTQFELTRKWIEDLSSEIVADGMISQYLDTLEDAWRQYLVEVKAKLSEEIKQLNGKKEELADISGQIEELKEKISTAKGNRKGFSFFGKRAVDLVSSPGTEYHILKGRLAGLKKKEEEACRELERSRVLISAGDNWKKLEDNYTSLDSHLEKIGSRLEERHQKMTLLMRQVETGEDLEWNNILNDYRRTRAEKAALSEDLNRHIAFSGYLLEGLTEEKAAIKAIEIERLYKSQFNSQILGRKYFPYCPVFEIFEDFGSLLPNRIDLADIISGNEKVEGYKAARNFLTLARIDPAFFDQPSTRILKQKIENLNHSLTCNFQDFWQQSIGRNNKINIHFELDHYDNGAPGKAGKPYLEFWIKDERERLYPKQRSRGVRWFLSFYMELKAAACNENRPMVLLVDEPGVSLHARAQEDVLKVFDDISPRIQVIYTTHSPHLVDKNKMHRVLAVQRDDVDSNRSTTRLLDPMKLSFATKDTLTPLQGILTSAGDGFSGRDLNMIVNDTGSFYLLTALIHLTGFRGKINIIPATDISTVPLMCNIMMGWGLEFSVILFGNEREEKTEETLRETIFNSGSGRKELIIKLPKPFSNAEDLLSTLDFKKHVMNTREGITISNSAYIIEKQVSRNFVLSVFLSKVRSGEITMDDLDEETSENFRNVYRMLASLK